MGFKKGVTFVLLGVLIISLIIPGVNACEAQDGTDRATCEGMTELEKIQDTIEASTGQVVECKDPPDPRRAEDQVTNCKCVWVEDPTSDPSSPTSVCAASYQVVITGEGSILAAPSEQSCVVHPNIPAAIGCVILDLLPFYSWFNVLGSVVLVAVVYVFMVFRRKKSF